jgi:hypothetical protein
VPTVGLPHRRLTPALVCVLPSQVTVASVEQDLTVTCSRKVRVVADASIEDCAGEWDLIALPVGQTAAIHMHAFHLADVCIDLLSAVCHSTAWLTYCSCVAGRHAWGGAPA